MNTNPSKQGALTANSAGIGAVTPEMVRQRAVQLAVINGRSAQEVSASDREQAQLELTGNAEADAKELLLESVPESQRWDPVPGSTGGKVPVPPGEDEDAEGRSDQEQLVDEGIASAERDLARRAALE